MSRCEGCPGRLCALVAALAALLAACTEGPLGGPGALGGLDPRRVAAVGDSYLAGATDGALFASAQETSVPALFARQAGAGSDFRQPLISDPGIATDDIEAGRLALVGAHPLALARLPRGEPLALGLDRPYDNLAVPNALLDEALVAQSAATSIFGNRFYDLVLRGRGTFARQTAELDPTLVLLSLGTYDVLTFVARGGDPSQAPGLPTPVGTFELVYRALIDSLARATDQIVLFNVPDVTRLPIVQAVPNVVLEPATGDTLLITVSEPKIDPVTGLPVTDPQGNPVFVQRQKPVPLLGPAGPLASTDRVTLAALPLLAQGIGVPRTVGGTDLPLPDRAVLDAAEMAEARTAVEAYNGVIARIAEERDLAVVDVHGLVEAMSAGGVVSDGIRLTTDWLTGQAFSLDGATFTPKGYGVVANLLIDTLNAQYGSRLRHVRTSDLPGIRLLGR